ncbi:CYTH and CHAD domain-containing protein [Hydrogenophaga aquatica]
MPSEIELKLLLPGADARTIVQTLTRHPSLARRPRQEQWLTNVYFDTPQQTLRQQRCALRLRHVAQKPGAAQRGQWLQTFKTAGVSQGGLSQRGEWETAVTGKALDFQALAATPLAAMGDEHSLLAALSPCFETRCHRTTWLVRRRDGTAMEVALDVGEIVAGGRTEPLLELELELLAGQPDALFDLAESLARNVAVLPCDISKAERGYALAAGSQHAPARARPGQLSGGIQPVDAARLTMGEMLEQFTRNLSGLLHSDAPELVHQARVAWRRWRSASRLFRPWLPPTPDRSGLASLLTTLGRLRDRDVARTETLPSWAPSFADGDSARQELVQTCLAQLDQACAGEREAARRALATPATGLALLALTRWLHALKGEKTPDRRTSAKARPDWARERMDKLQRRLKHALDAARQHGASDALGHDARLLAKRTRYSIEALQGLLPRGKARHWLREASDAQLSIGAERDLQQAVVLLQGLAADNTLIAFLQGVAAGRANPAAH